MKLFSWKRLLTKFFSAGPHSALSTQHSALPLRLIRLIGVIVPRRLRADWRMEWESELQYREALLAEWERLDWRNRLDLLWRSTSAFWDALWLLPQRWEDEMIQDLRFGLRAMRKNPGFTLLVAFTLSLGIGANTAIFSVVRAVLLRPLPYESPECLVAISETDTQRKLQNMAVAGPNFLDWRGQSQSFDRMAAFDGEGKFNLTGEEFPERVNGANVSEDFFPTLGVAPALGRGFLPEEVKPGAPPVVVLSHTLWQRRFGADRGVIGQTIRINEESATVVGVMPPHFRYPTEAELWMPFDTALHQFNRSLYMLKVIARLRPDVTITQARAEMETIAQRLAQQYPETNKDRGVHLISLQDDTVGEVKLALQVLMGAVLFVLLIACTNIASLLLGRAVVRRREMGIRAALGAGRIRLFRQLLVESLLLALAGGAGGLVLARWGMSLLFGIHPQALPAQPVIQLDAGLLAFTLLASLLTGVIFGLAPAWLLSGTDLRADLHGGGRGAVSSSLRLRSVLVVAEISLALVLLIGAGLLIRSFWQLVNVEIGFDARNVLTMQLQLPEKEYSDSTRAAAFYDQLVQRVQTLPGVHSVGVVNTLPMSGVYMQGLEVEGAPPPTPGQRPITAFRVATPGYFNAMGIGLLNGRGFLDTDRAETLTVVIIDRTTARMYWPEGQARGKRIKLGGPQDPWLTVIGVVGDVRYHGLDRRVFPTIYVPHAQSPFLRMMLAIRTNSDPTALVPAVKSQVAALDRNLPISKIQTMEQIIAGSVTTQRFNLTLLGTFAGLALFLATIGIYGVISYTVSQRRQEIGIRMALGMNARDVARLIVGQGMKLTLLGVALGLGGALALTRWMRTMLFNLTATDPLTFTAIALLLIAVAMLACWLPARRATRVDPLVALRHE